jgi:hypothetical protein
MKKGKVFFHPIEGSGHLTISWSKAPKGDAIEAKKGNGVGFFSHTGDLLCVIFDEIQSDSDHQTLEFAHHKVEVTVENGDVIYKCSTDTIQSGKDCNKPTPRSPKTGIKRPLRRKPVSKV